LRRIILQIHLWSALICGAYVVVISLSGSAVVLRREFGRWFSSPNYIEVRETRLSEATLRSMAQEAYPGAEIASMSNPADPRLPVAVHFERRGREFERRFDPYDGTDLGDPYPPVLAAMSWMVELHDNLLVGLTGRRVNGIGGAAFLLIVLTGAILWWPGRSRWLRSLTFSWRQRGFQFLWRLHSSLGFWSFPLLLVWGITAVYFAFPEPFEATIDRFDPDPLDFERPGEKQLLATIAAHFGRFGPLPIRFVWMALGLVPVVLFVTGLLLWLKKRRGRFVSG
jgi:uncharacterized iron-regulated membrane protein